MNNTLKILLLNLLFLAPCAIEAMNPLRKIGAKALQAASFTGARFIDSIRKAGNFMQNQPVIKNNAQRSYLTYAKIAAPTVATAGFGYVGYKNLKEWHKWQDVKKQFNSEAMLENLICVPTKAEKERNAQRYLQFCADDWENLFNSTLVDEKEVIENNKLFAQLCTYCSDICPDELVKVLRNVLENKICETNIRVATNAMEILDKLAWVSNVDYTQNLIEKVAARLEKDPLKTMELIMANTVTVKATYRNEGVNILGLLHRNMVYIHNDKLLVHAIPVLLKMNTKISIDSFFGLWNRVPGKLPIKAQDAIKNILLENVLETEIDVLSFVLNEQRDVSFLEDLIVKVTERLQKDPADSLKIITGSDRDHIDFLYKQSRVGVSVLPSLVEKGDKLRSVANNVLKQSNQKITVDSVLASEKIYIPTWLSYESCIENSHKTQTDAHFCSNTDLVSQAFWRNRLNEGNKPLKKILLDAYDKEKEEQAKGNYVFYHAQNWKLHYYADIYKQLWNIAKKDAVQDDFTFTRFNQQKKAPSHRKDALFLNHALFGNSSNGGSCTFEYFTNNRSIHAPTFSPREFCKDLGIEKHCTGYLEEFQKLEALHAQASKEGNLLLVSVPQDKIHHVIPYNAYSKVRIGNKVASETKKIIHALQHNPTTLNTSDEIEYVLPLTTDYALDPKKGPRFYSFNAADKTKLKEYEAARDALFAKIKKDYEHDEAKK